MISQTESFVHLYAAAMICTALLGVGMVGRVPRRRATSQSVASLAPAAGAIAPPPRRIRWLFVLGGVAASLMTLFVANAEARFTGRGSRDAFVTGIAVILGLVAGATLMLIGLRGRWIGEHPHCRRCGFDLFGKPPESNLCNECGSDLAAPRSTVVGVRHHRLVPLLAGAFLITLCGALGVSVISAAVGAGGGISLSQYKPVWWLTAELRGNDGPAVRLAGMELMRRLAAGKLPADTIEALAAMDETKAPNAPDFGPAFAEAAWSRGQLSEATLRAILRDHLRFYTTVAGRSLPTRIAFYVGPARVQPMSGSCAFHVLESTCEINGTAVPGVLIGTSNPRGAFSEFGALGHVLRLPHRLPLGPTTVRLRQKIELTYSVPGRPVVTETADVTLLDGKTIVVNDTGQMFADDGQRDPFVGRTNASVVVTPNGDSTTYAVAITTASRALFCGDAYLRVGKDEQKLGPITIENCVGSVTATLPEPALPGAFEIVLKPTNEQASDYVIPPPTSQREVIIDAPMIQRASTRPGATR